MEKHTHREYRAWMAWLASGETRWNLQEPTHWYLAQIAREIRASNLKRPRQAKVKQFLLKFDTGNKPPPDPKKVAEQAKARWMRWVGTASEKEK